MEYKHLLGVSLVAVLLGCGGDGSGAGETRVCGNTRCSVSAACCTDCDGTGLCLAPGEVCPGNACETDGGVLADSGIACGDLTCEAGNVCCSPCPEIAQCQAPGRACEATDCPPLHGQCLLEGEQGCNDSNPCCDGYECVLLDCEGCAATCLARDMIDPPDPCAGGTSFTLFYDGEQDPLERVTTGATPTSLWLQQDEEHEFYDLDYVSFHFPEDESHWDLPDADVIAAYRRSRDGRTVADTTTYAAHVHEPFTVPADVNGSLVLNQRGTVGEQHCGRLDVTFEFTYDGAPHELRAVGQFAANVAEDPLPGTSQ